MSRQEEQQVQRPKTGKSCTRQEQEETSLLKTQSPRGSVPGDNNI